MRCIVLYDVFQLRQTTILLVHCDLGVFVSQLNRNILHRVVLWPHLKYFLTGFTHTWEQVGNLRFDLLFIEHLEGRVRGIFHQNNPIVIRVSFVLFQWFQPKASTNGEKVSTQRTISSKFPFSNIKHQFGHTFNKNSFGIWWISAVL